MDLSFDIRGNLQPYSRHKLGDLEFKDFFVNSFAEDSSRHRIFENYIRYTSDLQSKVTKNFRQWINGSFVSNKKNPKDIDLVNLIDYKIAKEMDSVIRTLFIGTTVAKTYGIDAYLILVYPEDHKLHNWTKSDMAYWSDWFSKSKMNRAKKRFSKGYIELNFKD